MLISKSIDIAVGDVMTFKMTNGDEIVASVDKITDTTIIMKKPYVVVPNQQGLGIMPVMFSVDADQKVSVARSQIMMHAPTTESVVKHYTQVTSGIQI